MAEYWQDKRINRKHVACAWGLVLVAIAMMLAVASQEPPECSRLEAAPGTCAKGTIGQQASNARR